MINKGQLVIGGFSQEKNHLDYITCKILNSFEWGCQLQGISIYLEEIPGDNNLIATPLAKNHTNNFDKSKKVEVDIIDEYLMNFKEESNYYFEIDPLQKELELSEHIFFRFIEELCALLTRNQITKAIPFITDKNCTMKLQQDPSKKFEITEENYEILKKIKFGALIDDQHIRHGKLFTICEESIDIVIKEDSQKKDVEYNYLSYDQKAVLQKPRYACLGIKKGKQNSQKNILGNTFLSGRVIRLNNINSSVSLSKELDNKVITQIDIANGIDVDSTVFKYIFISVEISVSIGLILYTAFYCDKLIGEI